ncbi:hypothetical protein, partial [Varibaculum cambriense]|uniref:hypothetical protein n=1 Tax=Varibaculum cambriense TaxID=184870 RepID=UPI00290CFDCE
HQHQKNKKQKKPNPPTKNSKQAQLNPTQTKQKTHYREHKQPNHKPTKLADQDSLRAKNNRRKTRFPPASSLSNEYKVTAPTPTGQTRLGKSKRDHNSSDFHRIFHYGVEKVPAFLGLLGLSNPNKQQVPLGAKSPLILAR